MTIDGIKDKVEHLNLLKKGDFIWVVKEHPMFQMYRNIHEMNSSQYLGYDSGDVDADYNDSMYVLKAISPTIYAPTKMAFVAKVINEECKDDIAYMFSSNMHEFEIGNFKFGQHIVRSYNHFRGYKSQYFYLDALKFESGIEVSVKDVFFNEQDCIKECRERNRKYRSTREINLIGKTINSLKKQFETFKKSDLFIDAKEQIEKDLNERKGS